MRGWQWTIKYSPEQPRIPGGPGGGRWTKWGTGSGPFTARFSEVAPSDFRKALDANLSKRYSAYVSRYEPEEYERTGAKTYLMDDGRTGFALKPDGDIVSVFSGTHQGRAALQAAIELGGKKLDCYDGFLSKFYSRFGFKEYERWPWDEQYKPADWDKRDDQPDVVLM